MTEIVDSLQQDGLRIVRLRSEHLEVDVAPQVGGRIVGIRHLGSGHEFLWRNSRLRLERCRPGSEYDPNFYGGIDELLPNDIPETIGGVACPDHGELWTRSLDWRIDGRTLLLEGELPQFGLTYERRMRLRADSPHVDFHYRLTNPTGAERHFLWKLHAALAVEEGDVIDCPARQAQVVDLAYSRFSTLRPFAWPHIEGQRADVVPAQNGTVDFFYLFDLQAGRIAWRRESAPPGLRRAPPSGPLRFEYTFDTKVFPCAWLFASYGGLDGHYTIVLEPCSTMPIRVDEAIRHGRCSRLLPGEVLETEVSLYAGPDS
ncbi:MAG: DUF5107 domain-containing protein [Pirellulales bacterium]|nr:DUF5107 domain-containing protein [Pirellulales bacterium]